MSAHGGSSRFAKDFTDSEGEGEAAVPASTTPADSPDPLQADARERNPLSASASTETVGDGKPPTGISTALKLPVAPIGAHPPRKKSQMDWLHGRHPSQLQKDGAGSPSNKGVPGQDPVQREAGPSTSSAAPSDAQPKPKKKRAPAKKAERPIAPTPEHPVHREIASSTSAMMYEDPYAEEDELDALHGPQTPQPLVQPPPEALAGSPSQPPSVQRIKLIPPPMPGLMRKQPDGSVAGSEGGEGPPKKKRKPAQPRKAGVPGPGKAWRKGLKDADRLKAKSDVPSAPSSVDGVEPSVAASNPRKRKAGTDALPLPLPATIGGGSSKAGAARKSGGGNGLALSDAEDELAEIARRQAARDRSQGLSDVDYDEARDDVEPPQVGGPSKNPAQWQPSRREERYTVEQLHRLADDEDLDFSVYRNHIPAKAIPVYRIPSPVRVKERELAATIPVKTQVGPPPRAWQIGTRIVLGVGGAHIRLKSWMSTGRSPFAAYRHEQAEATRAQQAQAMYAQQQQQMMAGQQAMFDHGIVPFPQPSLQGWAGPDASAAASPYQGGPVGGMPDPAYHASQAFMNQLSPLPPNQASPAQLLPGAPAPGGRQIYGGAHTQPEPAQPKKPQRRRKPGEPDGRTKGARKAKQLGLMQQDTVVLASLPSSPAPLGETTGADPAPVSTTPPGFPSVLSGQDVAVPLQDTAGLDSGPPPKPKAKRKSRSKRSAPVVPQPVADPFGDDDELEGASVSMIKQASGNSGNSLDKEMEDLL